MDLRVRLALTALALCFAARLAPAQEADRPRTDVVDVAIADVVSSASALDEADQAERLATARLALEIAGRRALPELTRRLTAARSQGAEGVEAPEAPALAWAIGVASAPTVSDALPRDAARAAAIGVLRRCVLSGSWPLRLASASSLGVLEAREAQVEIVGTLLEASRPQDAEGPLLLALAGVGGDAASSVLDDALALGGDMGWTRSVLALAARRGSSCWPSLVSALETSPEESVRATAAAALLVLAEPASACGMGEIFGRQPSQGTRLTLVQALAATATPQARGLLAVIASQDADADVREASSILHASSLEPPLVPATRPGSSRVREALDSLARGRAFPRDLRDVEAGASLVDVPAIERTLRLLPLREDGAWLEEHVRLAQVRARLLCAAWPDGVPVERPRVRRR